MARSSLTSMAEVLKSKSLTNNFMEKYLDNRGHLIGREVNGMLLDGKGKPVARYISSSNITVDGTGKNVGRSDLKTSQLGKNRN